MPPTPVSHHHHHHHYYHHYHYRHHRQHQHQHQHQPSPPSRPPPGDFEGFSFLSFLPGLAVIVMLQIIAKIRADGGLGRGAVYVRPPPEEAGWKKYKAAQGTNAGKMVQSGKMKA